MVMKQVLLLTLLLFCISSFQTEKEVYICDSPTALKYHYKSDCKGLEKCTHEVKKISLTEAKALKYTVCGYED